MPRKLSPETIEKNRLRTKLWQQNNKDKEILRKKNQRLKKQQYISSLEAQIKELENDRSNRD